MIRAANPCLVRKIAFSRVSSGNLVKIFQEAEAKTPMCNDWEKVTGNLELELRKFGVGVGSCQMLQ